MAGAVTNYHWNDLDQLVEQDGANGTLLFYHDDKGDIGAVVFNGTKYSFRRNAQGDVTAILDLANNIVAKYTYDAWGKVLSVTDANGNAITAPNHIANVNPIRYRGYYYDTETGLYYLNSRYYDPQTGRFLNADAALNPGTGLVGMNLFAYCNNNPVLMIDDAGTRPMLNDSGVESHTEASLSAKAMMATKNKEHSSLPVKGTPNSKVKSSDGKQEREYDSDGRAKKDTDYGHPEHHPDLPSPHYHDWNWSNPTKPRGDAYSQQLNPTLGLCLIAAATVGTILVIADDATGFGAADDAALPVLGSTIRKGIIMIFGG